MTIVQGRFPTLIRRIQSQQPARSKFQLPTPDASQAVHRNVSPVALNGLICGSSTASASTTRPICHRLQLHSTRPALPVECGPVPSKAEIWGRTKDQITRSSTVHTSAVRKGNTLSVVLSVPPVDHTGDRVSVSHESTTYLGGGQGSSSAKLLPRYGERRSAVCHRRSVLFGNDPAGGDEPWHDDRLE
ncbi:hypothetical protein T310_1951 [Rasamsonia emersonii CBS 393.64]|uniref:Uncharacterized protein n=1 Tax=Rasamsonia emersonii (strain ATCC 16479 / CBS 393.64 / IMI 116815) TaxID=1408163 RepID=A0A0F4Z0Y0_RASE3|nr:hypothetical protein T310_1951 [Rasamsonia emersonii CBS 393.64]KKA24030.1 hypothetical protein T310_1951 [Rasamsonia emersonii CBS 393.64]